MKRFRILRPRLRSFQWVRGYVAFEAEGFDADGNAPKAVVLSLGDRRLECLRMDPSRTGAETVRFRRFFRTGKGLKWITVRAIWADGGETAEGHFLAVNFSRRPPDPFVRDYRHFLERNAPTAGEIRRLGETIGDLSTQPKISVVMPTFNTAPRLLRAAVDSVKEQVYPNWELCIADDASTRRSTRRALRSLMQTDRRIRVVFRDRNGHISEASNSALDLATGEWVALLDHDDLLLPQSLARMVLEINRHPEARFIYSDEDKVDASGKPLAPYFKPDWNPLLLFSQNYVCHLSCVRRDLVQEVGRFRKGFEGSQDWDLFLRLGKHLRPDEIRHVPEVLYHWRIIHGSAAGTVDEKSYSVQASRKALEEAVPWGKEGDWHLRGGMYWICEPPPTSSMTILTAKASASVVSKEDEEDVLVFVPPGARSDRAACERLAGWAARSEIGVAAGSLVDQNGALWEGGMVLGEEGAFQPLFRNIGVEYEGMGRREILPQNLLVPGRWFLAVRRALWQDFSEMSGKAESWTARVAALALSLHAAGFWNVFVPFCRVVVEDGGPSEPPGAGICREAKPFATDPFANPNLTAEPGFFTLQQDRKVERAWGNLE